MARPEPQLGATRDLRSPEQSPFPGHCHWLVSDDPGDLAGLCAEDITLAIWRRPTPPELAKETSQLLATGRALSLRVRCPTRAARLDAALDGLPSLRSWPLLRADLRLKIDMFACLFDLREVGLRLCALERAPCPRFHVDRVPVRLLCSYAGPGTQWLRCGAADRSRLGPGNRGLDDEQSGLILDPAGVRQLDTGDTALLKGELWPGNEERGLIHRSPQLPVGQRRLVLTLDAC